MDVSKNKYSGFIISTLSSTPFACNSDFPILFILKNKSNDYI